NWFEERPKGILGLRELRYGKNLRTAFRLGANLVILKLGENGWPSPDGDGIGQGRIDVWWRDDPTSRLMLLLAYLMTRSEEWGESHIRILASDEGKGSEETLAELTEILEEARIPARPEVLPSVSRDRIVEISRDADLLFLPFRIKGDKLVDILEAPVEEILPDLPATALVLAAEDVDLEAEPEEGTAGEWALALDALSDARKKAREAREEADRASESAREKLGQMETAITRGADEGLMSLVRNALDAKSLAEKSARKAAKALAKAELAEREAKALGAPLPESVEKTSEEKDSPSGS
ncbi:MAG: amino acid permease, partial [Deltaproteobacteria bacterium]|nr:amino acid permease [Deltaproteobacteria bacterium]